MNKRNDIHSPTNITPSDYTCFGWDYYGSVTPPALLNAQVANNKYIKENSLTVATHDHGGTCHICGAYASYVALFHHIPSGQYIVTGFDCADKIDLSVERSMFRNAKSIISEARKYASGIKAARETLENMGLTDLYEWSQSNEAYLNDSLKKEYGKFWERTNSQYVTLRSMVDNLVRYGSWSENQKDYAQVLWEIIKKNDWKEKADVIIETARIENENAADAPTGRQEVELKILSIRTPDEYDKYQTFKMLGRTRDGWKAWVTVPTALLNADVIIGDYVQLTATWTPSETDAKFAWGNRPSKSSVLKKVAEK